MIPADELAVGHLRLLDADSRVEVLFSAEKAELRP
jgi:hypothetical protein